MRRVEITFQFTECVPISKDFTCVFAVFLRKNMYITFKSLQNKNIEVKRVLFKPH